jgi:hypothetical protein
VINAAGDSEIKVPNMKFVEIRGSRADTCGQTDGHDESNRGYGGYANASKNQPQNEWKIVALQNFFLLTVHNLCK